jgi:hypothetical protein
MRPIGVESKLVRRLLRLLAIAYPLAIGTGIYLSVGRNWPWYESVPAGFGVLWATSVTWIGWEVVVTDG